MKITIEIESLSELYELRDLLTALRSPTGSGAPSFEAAVEAGIPLNEVTGFDSLKLLTRSCLIAMELRTLDDLTRKTDVELLRFPNFGRRSLIEVKEWLASHGLSLAHKQAKVSA